MFAEAAAVDDFHLEIGDGEFVSLLGPSGCGKTTTLAFARRFFAAGRRRDTRRRRSASHLRRILVPPERRHMSMIFQSYAVWPHMTVAQNVAYGLKFKETYEAGNRDGKSPSCSVSCIWQELKDRYSAELSGGQRRRSGAWRARLVVRAADSLNG